MDNATITRIMISIVIFLKLLPEANKSKERLWQIFSGCLVSTPI